MSEYTIMNFISEEYSTDIKQELVFMTKSSVCWERQNGNVILLRVGGDKRTEIRENVISEKNGKLIYDAPINLNVETDEFIGYFIIDYYEDTGDHHEAELYSIYAYNKSILIDEIKIYDDSDSEKISKYFKNKHGINTALQPP